MPEPLITLAGLSKFHGDRIILRNLNFQGWPGSLTLIQGANGAGKSTLLRIMAGLDRAVTGKVELAENLRIAYLGHPTFIYPGLTAFQNLEFQAKINSLSISGQDILNLLKKAGLAAYAYEPAGVFSRGMAQRLNFCRALMLGPELLLLDEPFTGMDAPSQAAMRAELDSLRDRGACIVLVSHSPDADSTIATDILTLSKGSLSAKESPW